MQCDLDGSQSLVCGVKPIPQEVTYKRMSPSKVIACASAQSQTPTDVLGDRTQRGVQRHTETRGGARVIVPSFFSSLCTKVPRDFGFFLGPHAAGNGQQMVPEQNCHVTLPAL